MAECSTSSAQPQSDFDYEQTTIDTLPTELIFKILDALSYEDLSKIRLVSKKIDRTASQRLNHGYNLLGHMIDNAKNELKKELPRRESLRRSHRLCRLNEAYSAMETRYALLSMTYKKYIDAALCCFIPGKVLDEGFSIMHDLRNSKRRVGSYDGDISNLLKDMRDLSSMAMEHFEEYIQPDLRNPCHLDSILARIGGSGTTPSSSANSTPANSTLHSLFRLPFRRPHDDREKALSDRVAEQELQLKRQGVMIAKQNAAISAIVGTLNALCEKMGEERMQEVDLAEDNVGDKAEEAMSLAAALLNKRKRVHDALESISPKRSRH